jgi:hypothetical protein
VHPGASATNLFTRQLEQTGRTSPGAGQQGRHHAAAPVGHRRRAVDAAGVPSTPSGAFVGLAGLAEHRGRPRRLDLYTSAKDPTTAARLWELTKQVLGRAVPV